MLRLACPGDSVSAPPAPLRPYCASRIQGIMSAPALSKLVAASFAAAAASSSSTAAASSRAAASSKRSKQVHSSASAHIADDAPFVPHQTHSAFFAAPSACGCGLATGTARILVCGDGDLSYSVGLVRHLVSDSHRERPDGQREGEFTFDNFTSEEDARALRVQSSSLTGDQRFHRDAAATGVRLAADVHHLRGD